MIHAWQKRLLNNKPVFIKEYNTPGEYDVDLDAGVYEGWLIGAGAGGAILNNIRTTGKTYAQGGVGGTLHVRFTVPERTTIKIIVGARGINSASTYTGSGVSATATAGGDSYITGLANTTMQAGGGTHAQVVSTSSTSASGTAGLQGTNTAVGDNILAILANNATVIKSATATSTATRRTPTGAANLNWLEKTSTGAGGDLGWDGNNILNRLAGQGFVRIYSI